MTFNFWRFYQASVIEAKSAGKEENRHPGVSGTEHFGQRIQTSGAKTPRQGCTCNVGGTAQHQCGWGTTTGGAGSRTR